MDAQGDEGNPFDIGVEAGQPNPPRSAGLNRVTRRPLPRWAVAAIALLVGWLLGSLLTGENEAAVDEPIAAEPATPATPEGVAQPTLVELPPTSGASPTFDFSTPDTTEDDNDVADSVLVVMVNAPLRGVAIPADITVIDGGISTKIEVDRQISGAIEGALGQAERRILVVDDAVVFMALDAVMTFDLDDGSNPTELATAIYLLEGSSPGRVWAVTSGSQSVIDIDVRNRRAHAEYDLRDIGSPLGSFDGGLVIAPVDVPAHGPIALWTPAQGITEIPSIYADADFIGAAADTLVFIRRGGLATYNTITGWNWQTPVDLPPAAQRRALVSPDAHSLAVALQGTVTELPVVQVLDIETATQIDWFEAAFAWQMRWVSDTELLFLAPAGDGVQVMLRNTSTGTTQTLTDLVGPNFWVAVAG